jgi:hypothetical protein
MYWGWQFHYLCLCMEEYFTLQSTQVKYQLRHDRQCLSNRYETYCVDGIASHLIAALPTRNRAVEDPQFRRPRPLPTNGSLEGIQSPLSPAAVWPRVAPADGACRRTQPFNPFLPVMSGSQRELVRLSHLTRTAERHDTASKAFYECRCSRDEIGLTGNRPGYMPRRVQIEG